jgi:DNA recombination protein Rad52
MSRFSNRQLRKLVTPLDRSRVQSREVEGRELHYIEGWFAISEANAIFGHDGWDREMVQFERVFERTRSEGTSCGYMARVRISVRTGDDFVVREGTGFGHGLARWPSEAHERAIKAAETDATKRALATFGNRFGLSLYDKEQNSVSSRKAETVAGHGTPNSQIIQTRPSHAFVLTGADGAICAERLSAESFCAGLRQLVDAAQTAEELATLRTWNGTALVTLRKNAPGLKSAKGEHYVDILERLIAVRLAAKNRAEPKVHDNRERDKTVKNSGRIANDIACEGNDDVSSAGNGNDAASNDGGNDHGADQDQAALAHQPASHSQSPSSQPPANISIAPNPSRIAPGGAIDKAMLSLPSERRVRNKAHLVLVASKPCIVCGELPCHAHHITFAQARGLSVKVSDEFTIPLCVLHHNEVHRSGSEKSWWRKQGIDPLAAAQALWSGSCAAQAEMAECSTTGNVHR